MTTTINLVGTVATVPRVSQIRDQLPVCSFRVACNERRYDRERGDWVDGPTSWYTVNAFRSLATHAGNSFSKGDRVIISGRLRIRDWEQKERSGTSAEVEADALGHDLRWGTSRFTKLSGASPGTEDAEHSSAMHHDESGQNPQAPNSSSTGPANTPGFSFGADSASRPEHENRSEDDLVPAF